MKSVPEDVIEIVRESGILIKEMMHKKSVKVTHKKDSGDLVTSADLEVQQSIFTKIMKIYPDHGFCSEEGKRVRPDAEYVWILDPIDGTKHYAIGNPLYAISLALKREGELIRGLVYIPEMDQMYYAEKGGNALLNGHSIHCSLEERLDETILCLEMPSRHESAAKRKWALEKIGILVDHVQRVRIIGVGSIGLCLCAMGGYDAYVSLSGAWKCYDLAAGQVVLQAAGGEFLMYDRRIVAGPAVLCKRIASLLDL